MKRSNDFFWKEVRSEIENELKNIEKLTEEFADEKNRNSRRAQGSILHDFYNCCERIFRRISSSVNGGFPLDIRWHKELLYRMTIPVEKVRPAVISKKLAAELDEYLSFRHVFRNIYGFELESSRLDNLKDKIIPVSRQFKNEITGFINKMEGK